MLTELLNLLEENDGELDLQALSRHLGAQPSAVAGMIDLLIQKGRVEEVGADCGICDTCGLRENCTLPVNRARRYRLSFVDRQRR